MTMKGCPPKYHNQCSKCGGERDEAGRYCKVCRRAYQNARNRERTKEFNQLRALAKQTESTSTGVTLSKAEE